MSPFRVAAKIDAMYRGFGIILAIEMAARGVLTILASLGRDTVFQVTASTSFPFTLIGGVLTLVTHLARAESRWRYLCGVVGHLIGMIWAFMFGASILISYFGFHTGSGITGPAFIVLSIIHGGFAYASVKGVTWTHKASP
jgi:hypothetical protein